MKGKGIHLYRAKHPTGGLLYVWSYDDKVPKGTEIIARTRFGVDQVNVLGKLKEDTDLPNDVSQIERVATEKDKKKAEDLQERAKKILQQCRKTIRSLKIPLAPVKVHILLCENKFILFFTAKKRVDFRVVVRELTSIFRMKIELRQIKAREETRVLGGIGTCGREVCCRGVASTVTPVSMKEAKNQGCHLSSERVVGLCGCLRCCLTYEGRGPHSSKSSESNLSPLKGEKKCGSPECPCDG